MIFYYSQCYYNHMHIFFIIYSCLPLLLLSNVAALFLKLLFTLSSDYCLFSHSMVT